MHPEARNLDQDPLTRLSGQAQGELSHHGIELDEDLIESLPLDLLDHALAWNRNSLKGSQVPGLGLVKDLGLVPGGPDRSRESGLERIGIQERLGPRVIEEGLGDLDLMPTHQAGRVPRGLELSRCFLDPGEERTGRKMGHPFEKAATAPGILEGLGTAARGSPKGGLEVSHRHFTRLGGSTRDLSGLGLPWKTMRTPPIEALQESLEREPQNLSLWLALAPRLLREPPSPWLDQPGPRGALLTQFCEDPQPLWVELLLHQLGLRSKDPGESARLPTQVECLETGQLLAWLAPSKELCQEEPPGSVASLGVYFAPEPVSEHVYEISLQAEPSLPPSSSRSRPKTQVSWAEAEAFARARGGRLPRRLEWDQAHRQGLLAPWKEELWVWCHDWDRRPSHALDPESELVGNHRLRLRLGPGQAPTRDPSGSRCPALYQDAETGFALVRPLVLGDWDPTWEGPGPRR